MKEKFDQLEEALNAELYERHDVVHTAVLAIVSQRTHIQIGEPGVGKSAVLNQLMKRIDGLTEEDYFHYQLTPHTEPHELFGGADLKLLKETGEMKRITKRKAPRAKFINYEEVFRGGSAILNANLMMLNERKFINGDDDPRVPLMTLFGSTNSFPNDPDLEALKDRMDFRLIVHPLVNGDSFEAMLRGTLPETPETVIHIDDIVEAQRASREVEIPDDVIEAIISLRHTLSREGIRPSDRRWRNCISIIQAEAYLHGRDYAVIEDIAPLQHVLWMDDTQVRKTASLVLQQVSPIEDKLLTLYDDINEVYSVFMSNVRDAEGNDNKIANSCTQTVKKTTAMRDELMTLEAELSSAGRTSVLPAQIKTRIRDIATQALNLRKQTLNEAA